MTNGWVDIKNADVILAMGGNPAENHPVGFKWFIEAKKTRNAKLVVVDPRFTRTAAVADLYSPDPRRHRHRLPARHHPLRPREQALPRGLRQAPHQRVLHHRREVRLRRRALLRLRRGEGRVRQGRPGPTRPTRRPGPTASTPTLQHPRCVFQLLKKHVDALHAGDGRADLRHAEGDVPEGGRDRDLDRQRRAGGHDHLRAGLDAALDRRADDPRGGDAAAPARQRRPARRRRQRLPRPLQHPGRDRHRGHLRDPARLPEDAHRRRSTTLAEYLEKSTPDHAEQAGLGHA